MAQVQLDTKEVQDFLTHIIKNNRKIQAEGLVPTAVEVTGEAGLGKTSVAIAIGEVLGLDVVKINLSQIEDLGDLVGYPVKQFQMIKPAGTKALTAATTAATKVVLVEKKMPNGQIIKVKKTVPAEATAQTGTSTSGNKEWIDELAVQQYAALGYKFTGVKRMSYAAPEWITDKTGGGLLILDDYTRA